MALQGPPLLLLLLLAAALVVLGIRDREDEDTPYERFLCQHVRPKSGRGNDAYCNKEMRQMLANDRRVNRDREKVCKEWNTFIHGNSDDIRAVCTAQGGQASGTESGQLMRQSLCLFQVTNCKLHKGKPIHNCRYWGSSGSRTIVIACNKNGFPMHLDESRT